MIATKVAAGLGIAVLAVLCWLAIQGFTVVTEGLVTLAALVGMIAGGSWFNNRMGIYGRRGAVAAPPAGRVPDGDRYCPGAELTGRGTPPAEHHGPPGGAAPPAGDIR
ncbi:MAG: hypothetical protein ACRDYZ_08115 [Acidimicrobiales bacterium]